jgi:K+-sensing histidine kinase KdpD
MITVGAGKSLAVGIVGLVLGAGCGCLWQGVATFAADQCASAINEYMGSLCRYNVVLYYPIGIVVAAMATFVLMAVALAALRIRPWSYAVFATPSVIVFAALAYHTHLTPAAKIFLAALVVGLGAGIAAALDEFQVRRQQRVRR